MALDTNRRDFLVGSSAALGTLSLGCTADAGSIAPSPVTLRRSEDRGHANHGWLDTRHSFSFARYRDPAHMGFRSLRVINQDRVAPGAGFGMHPHRDMEILSYVIDGALEHKDSIGNGSIIRPGEVQRMSAGSGVRHSEFNPLADTPVHFLQIWLLPDRPNHEPSYEQKSYSVDARTDQLRLVASHDGRKGSVVIHQDANLYSSYLARGRSLTHALAPNRHAWLQLISGELELNGKTVRPGDGASTQQSGELSIRATRDAHFLLFDLA
ncbi:MAG: pirin family protein [Myxococcota bacterium]